MMKLSIIIPVYNEEATLAQLLDKVLEQKFPVDTEIIIVNDSSRDSSQQIIDKYCMENSHIKSFVNEVNLGKSQTVAKGIRESVGEYVTIQDADLEYDPKELLEIYEMAINQDLDVVYGNRFGTKNEVIYIKNFIGNRSLSAFSNIFTYPRIKVFIPDMEVCYKMIRGDIARDLGQNIESVSNFGFEPEITAKLSRYKVDGKHLKFKVYPIHYYPRSVEDGKKMKAFSDGYKALKEIFRFNL